MDYGLAAEGIGNAVMAMIVLGSLALHAVAAALATIDLCVRRPGTRLLSTAALLIVACNHAWLVHAGFWTSYLLPSVAIWATLIVFLTIYILCTWLVVRRKDARGRSPDSDGRARSGD